MTGEKDEPLGSSHFTETGIYRSRCGAKMSLYAWHKGGEDDRG